MYPRLQKEWLNLWCSIVWACCVLVLFYVNRKPKHGKENTHHQRMVSSAGTLKVPCLTDSWSVRTLPSYPYGPSSQSVGKYLGFIRDPQLLTGPLLAADKWWALTHFAIFISIKCKTFEECCSFIIASLVTLILSFGVQKFCECVHITLCAMIDFS